MMQKNTIWTFWASSLLALVILTGCSSALDRRQASGNFDYLDQPSRSVLIVPSNLEPPKTSTQYLIPRLGPNADPELVGERLDIRPPIQILALAPGTRVFEDSVSGTATLVVDALTESTNIDREINTTLIGFLSQEGIDVASNENGKIVTNWIEDEESIGRSWFRKRGYTLRQQYRFDTTLASHGRSGAVTVSLLNAEISRGNLDEDITLTATDRGRYATAMVNRYSSYLSELRGYQSDFGLLSERQGIATRLGLDNTVILAEAGFEPVWQQMAEALPQLGFEIIDRDQSLGLYFVNFEPDGIWRRIWGGQSTLPLEKGEYRVKLEGDDTRTIIAILDNNNQLLSSELVQQSYSSFAEALSRQE